MTKTTIVEGLQRQTDVMQHLAKPKNVFRIILSAEGLSVTLDAKRTLRSFGRMRVRISSREHQISVLHRINSKDEETTEQNTVVNSNKTYCISTLD